MFPTSNASTLTLAGAGANPLTLTRGPEVADSASEERRSYVDSLRQD